AMDHVVALIRQGADVNYTDPQSKISAFTWGFWMAYEADRPDVVEAFIGAGADLRQRYSPVAPMPMAERAAVRNLQVRPARPFARVSTADHAAIALLESQFLYVSHIETAINLIKQLQDHGVTINDLSMARSPNFRSWADLAVNPLGLAVM